MDKHDFAQYALEKIANSDFRAQAIEQYAARVAAARAKANAHAKKYFTPFNKAVINTMPYAGLSMGTTIGGILARHYDSKHKKMLERNPKSKGISRFKRYVLPMLIAGGGAGLGYGANRLTRHILSRPGLKYLELTKNREADTEAIYQDLLAKSQAKAKSVAEELKESGSNAKSIMDSLVGKKAQKKREQRAETSLSPVQEMMLEMQRKAIKGAEERKTLKENIAKDVHNLIEEQKAKYVPPSFF